MATLVRSKPLSVGPESNGMLMTPREFDNADFDDLWKYELVNGVLIVTPLPLNQEVDPNQELGYLLRHYRDYHPLGSTLDATLPEQHVHLKNSRRRADRVVWAGLGRMSKRGEKPTIAVEFVSKRSRDRKRDYETKRDEYLALGIKEYWVIDRFTRTMTVFTRRGGRLKTQLIQGDQTYKTDLLLGFELPLAAILSRADLWAHEESDE